VLKQQAIDLAVDAWWSAFYLTQHRVRNALPPLRRCDQERREEGRRAFNLGRDIERQELGLPPKYSEYFIEGAAPVRLAERLVSF
jgi:hypothetical protein